MRPSRKRSSTVSGVPDRAFSLEPSLEGGQVKLMVDRITKEHRSWNMSRIRSKDTSPELVVRSLLHLLGYRFRLHRKDLPGSPDIILPRYHVVIFLHGCFWHRHAQCPFAYSPKSRVAFWQKKFADNVQRDRNAIRELKKLGWNVVVIWECDTAQLSRLSAKLARKLIKGRLTD